MKKLLLPLFLVSSLLLFNSCELDDKITEGSLTTEEKYELINRQLNSVNYESPANEAYIAQEEAALEAQVEFTDTEITKEFSGSGYSGSVTIGENLTRSTMTITDTLNGETLTGATYTCIGTSTMTLNDENTVKMVITEDEYNISGGMSMSGLVTYDLTFSGAQFTRITGEFGFSFSVLFNETTLADENYEPVVEYTGTVTVDGVDYEASEFMEFMMIESNIESDIE